jgi:peptide/nickel transport system substrate-binding protein
MEARLEGCGTRGGEAGIARRDLLGVTALALAAGVPSLLRAAAPQGQLTWAVHVSLAPTWFDPAETPGIITPFMVMYAVHDAMLKPMPGNKAAPSLAESFTASEDNLTNDFVQRQGVKFHNGHPVTPRM